MIKLMLVDDHDQSLAIIRNLLENNGFEVEIAINGAEALEKIRAAAPDVVVTDILMPVMDGFSLCRSLKKNSDLSRIPLIFVSSTFVEAKDREFGLSLGAEGFILKTQKADQFISELKTMIEKCTAPGHLASAPEHPDDSFQDEYTEALNRKLRLKVLELEESNRRLRESESKFRLVTETIQDVFWTSTPGITETVYISPAYEKVWGKSCKSLYKNPLSFCDAIVEEDLNNYRDILEQFHAKGIAYECEYRIKVKDQEIRWIHERGAPVVDEQQKPILMAGICTDITEIKKAQDRQIEYDRRIQQSQKMESIGTLAGGIAHDFNNILSPLLGFAQMLREDIPEDSPSREDIDEVIMATYRARDLVRQILTFSRQDDQEIRPMKLQPIVKEALKLIRSSMPSTIEIQENIDPGCGTVNADPTQIHQIVMNLATNAYHAMEDMGGSLTVTLKQTQITAPDLYFPELVPGNYVQLDFSDTGCGMEEEVLNKIFDPYFTTKDKEKGIGLGLSVVQGIVKTSKGDIKVSSSPGKGTDIHIYLPLMEKKGKKNKIIPAESVPGGSETILLVDDEKPVLNVTYEMLKRAGYHVVKCTGCDMALAAFKDNPQGFDLLIADMTMPSMTGLQLAREIKQTRPDLPVIVCTGYSRKLKGKTPEDLAIQGIIKKPVERITLLKCVRNVMDL